MTKAIRFTATALLLMPVLFAADATERTEQTLVLTATAMVDPQTARFSGQDAVDGVSFRYAVTVNITGE